MSKIDSNPISPLLMMRGISKRFPGVQALDNVDFCVRPGEVHALVGENGAGKSTLMHILSGVYSPDSGTIDLFDRANVTLNDEQTAQKLGIAIVFQERSLFGPLSVAENLFAGRQPVRRFGWINRQELLADARRFLKEVGLDVDPQLPVERLSPHQQQLVEIAKALSLDARLIIFDEPTAALTESATRNLFDVIHRLRQRKIAVIYISHRLEEIFEIADWVTVLKDGCSQGTFAISETSPAGLVKKMVGRDLSLHAKHSRAVPRGDDIVLEVRDLSDRDISSTIGARLRNVNFSLRRGEILAMAGLAGAGRTETALSIFGDRLSGTCEVFVEGRPVRVRSVADAIAAGIGYLPEDRKEAGLFLDMSISSNIASAGLRRFGRFWLSNRRMKDIADTHRRSLRIASRSVQQTVLSLSGGNQQKVLLAKWLTAAPKVLIVDEPTRGVDVGGKAEVHRLLFELADQGTAVVVISSDLPEVLSVADRIVIMAGGQITGELMRDEATEEKIIHLASLAG